MVFIHIQVNVFAIMSKTQVSEHHCALFQQFMHIYAFPKTLFQIRHQVQMNLIRVSTKGTPLVHQSWHLFFGISQKTTQIILILFAMTGFMHAYQSSFSEATNPSPSGKSVGNTSNLLVRRNGCHLLLGLSQCMCSDPVV